MSQEVREKMGKTEPIENRYEFTLLIEAHNGNPNGDPDALGAPRVDVETSIGLITDVCTKHKIRNYVKLKNENESGYRIYIDDDVPLNEKQGEGFLKANGENAKITAEEKESARDWMCREYYDIRTFGAMMSTGKGAESIGNVVGPVQIAFGESIDPVNVAEYRLTRSAVTTREKFEKQEQKRDEKGTFGVKYLIPYGLYRINGYINPVKAKKTGFSEEDLNLLWEALENMYEFDRTAMRGVVQPRKLVVYKHESHLGNASAQKVLSTLKVRKKDDVEFPRSYDDYVVELNEDEVPDKVEVIINKDI